jgi:hypothetical protein
MEHFAAAHTDSDSSVYFYAADLLHVGDTWWNAYYPLLIIPAAVLIMERSTLATVTWRLQQTKQS